MLHSQGIYSILEFCEWNIVLHGSDQPEQFPYDLQGIHLVVLYVAVLIHYL